MKKLPRNRTFGFFMAAILAMVGFRQGVVFYGLSGILLGMAVFVPHLLLPLNRGWQKLGWLMGRFLSPIILAAVYYLLFSPMVLLLKVCGHQSFGAAGWVVKSKPCNFEKPF